MCLHGGDCSFAQSALIWLTLFIDLGLGAATLIKELSLVCILSKTLGVCKTWPLWWAAWMYLNNSLVSLVSHKRFIVICRDSNTCNCGFKAYIFSKK